MLTGECDFLSDQSLKLENELIQCSKSANENVLMEARLDGVRLDPSVDRVQTPPFNLTIPSNNPFGPGPTGNTTAIVGGYYLFGSITYMDQ